MSTREITESTFLDVIQKPGIVLIDWWASWCGPCRAFAPTYEATSTKHPDIVFAKVDTEAEPELAAVFSIRAIPTLMAFRDGILVYSQAGALPPAALERLIGEVRALDMAHVKKTAQSAQAGG